MTEWTHGVSTGRRNGLPVGYVLGVVTVAVEDDDVFVVSAVGSQTSLEYSLVSGVSCTIQTYQSPSLPPAVQASKRHEYIEEVVNEVTEDNTQYLYDTSSPQSDDDGDDDS